MDVSDTPVIVGWENFFDDDDEISEHSSGSCSTSCSWESESADCETLSSISVGSKDKLVLSHENASQTSSWQRPREDEEPAETGKATKAKASCFIGSKQNSEVCLPWDDQQIQRRDSLRQDGSSCQSATKSGQSLNRRLQMCVMTSSLFGVVRSKIYRSRVAGKGNEQVAEKSQELDDFSDGEDIDEKDDTQVSALSALWPVHCEMFEETDAVVYSVVGSHTNMVEMPSVGGKVVLSL